MPIKARGFPSLALVLALVAGAPASVPTSAKEISNESAMSTSLTVYPDGTGLPDGQGDALTGKPLYEQHCAACHGLTGKNGINSAIAGGVGTLTASAPNKTVGSYWPYSTTLYDYIRRAMPYTAPGTLTSSELYAITAYVLRLNNIIEADALMNKTTLPAVTMPNQKGFDWLE